MKRMYAPRNLQVNLKQWQHGMTSEGKLSRPNLNKWKTRSHLKYPGMNYYIHAYTAYMYILHTCIHCIHVYTAYMHTLHTCIYCSKNPLVISLYILDGGFFILSALLDDLKLSFTRIIHFFIFISFSKYDQFYKLTHHINFYHFCAIPTVCFHL